MTVVIAGLGRRLVRFLRCFKFGWRRIFKHINGAYKVMTSSRLPFKDYRDYPQSADLHEHFLRFDDYVRHKFSCLGLTIITVNRAPYVSPSIIRFSSLPEQWVQDYEDNNLALIDPIIQHSLSSTSRLVWDESFLQQSPEFAKVTKSYGFRSGISQSMRDVSGLTHLVILVCSDLMSAEKVESIELEVSHLMLAVQEVLEAFYLQAKSNKYTALSERELEVLRWAACGKTADETATILGLSERTINYHLGNCAAKLGVRTKTQALLKAVTLNVL